jgi:hypothetical protein
MFPVSIMKKCPYCGLENTDDSMQCVTCHTPLVSAPPELTGAWVEYAISVQEHRYWERMTFRQFGALMLRAQAIWLLFYAVVELPALVRYVLLWMESSRYGAAPGLNRELALVILRIAMYLAAAVLIFQHAERVLSWLVRDWVAKPPPAALGQGTGR